MLHEDLGRYGGLILHFSVSKTLSQDKSLFLIRHPALSILL